MEARKTQKLKKLKKLNKLAVQQKEAEKPNVVMSVEDEQDVAKLLNKLGTKAERLDSDIGYSSKRYPQKKRDWDSAS